MTYDACETKADYKNRKHAIVVARVSAVLCIAVLSFGYYTAWSNDRQHAEELAQMTEAQLAEQAIIESLQFGRVVLNEKGLIVSANAAFKKWTHWPDCVGKHIYEVMPEHLKPVHTTAFNLAVAKAAFSTAPKPKLIDCRLPRIDDKTKVTHVTLAVTVVRPQNANLRPYVVAYLFKTKSLQRVLVP